MPIAPQDIPSEYRTLSRRDHLKRQEYILSTEKAKVLNLHNYIDKSDCIDYTNSLSHENQRYDFFYQGNVYIIISRDSHKKTFNDNLKKLEIKISQEINSSTILDSHITDIINGLKNEIAHLSFTDVIVEFVGKESIQFTLSFSEKRLLMIDKFFHPEQKGLNEKLIFYSYFINRKLISSNVVESSDFVKKFKSYINV